MSLWGSIKNGISSIGSSLSHLTSHINTVLTDNIPGIKTELDLLEGRIQSAAKSGVQDAQTLEPLLAAAALGNVGALLGGAGSSLSGIFTSLTSALDNAVALAGKIQHSQGVQILQHLDQSYATFKDLSNQLHQDVKLGIAAELQIPSQIAGALTSIDASFGRFATQTSAQNRDIVSEVLNPAISRAGEAPLGQVQETLSPSVPRGVDQAAYIDEDKLTDLSPKENLEPLLDNFYSWVGSLTGIDEKTFSIGPGQSETVIHKHHGLIGNLVYLLWNGTQALEVLGIKLKSLYNRYEQDVNVNNPYELLSPGEVIEAWRRDLLTREDAVLELQKQGYDVSRIKTLYDIQQFMFNARESVDLYRRGIIDKTNFDVLMDQNNLDAGQVKSLQDLMGQQFSVGDLAALYWRGDIDIETYNTLAKGLGFTEENALVAVNLSRDVVGAREYAISRGRAGALGKGWLAGTLSQLPPPDVEDAYRRKQQANEQAVIDWLMHWRIPNAEWWVQAYFRGDAQLEDVYSAMQADNYPPEIWNSIIDVSRELLPTWMVPDIVASGTWDATQAIPHLMKLGFSQNSAQVLYDYGKSKSKTSKATTASALHGLSLGVSATLFDDGVITGTEYESILLDHGYGSEAASLTVELALLKQQAAARKEYAQSLIDQVKLGAITYTNAESDLYNQGYTDAEVAKYTLQLQQAQKANYKLPSRAELDKLFKGKFIDAQTWTEVMSLYGYSDFWIQKLINLV